MKTSIYICILFLTLVNLSCSSDDTEPVAEPQPVVTTFIVENYNTQNEPNTVILRKTYTVENNKIIASQRESLETGSTGHKIYAYENDRISEISNFSDGLLIEKKHFTYDDDGHLIEYFREITENSSPQALYIKSNYIHTQDTIYSIASQSTDGITYETNYTSKIVLDSNLNAIFTESTGISTDYTNRTIHTYDTNNNIISSMGYELMDNGTFFNTISSTYTYETGINTLGIIYDATFGREVLMLSSQHQDNSSALNNYNSKYKTFNTFDTYDSSFFGNVDMAAEFINTYNEQNYSTLSDYRMIIEGDIFSRFTIEYIFE
ncbi:hypothetical protein [Psychroserpens algicola]|uniref:YD repeat-containing protein n=1 Tax=Psychroserpens algicola TaxID=1719034 RepID=A0ABT0H8Q1_9FLAO|nr:hypothetical protein [Psychroserpens algicola]MCK8480567.1 hypothetical protein [Psychroserpens algicola]